MADEAPSPEKVAGIIPFFFYDIIGHIVPGGTLLLGLVWYFNSFDLSSWIQPIKDVFPKNPTAGGAALIVLLLFGVAHIVGILLKPISYWIVERAITRRIASLHLSAEGLRRFLGVEDIEDLRNRFQAYFGSKMSEEPSEDAFNRASFFCSYYTMRMNPNLGLMTSRWDAELLSTQSLCVVFLFLAVLPLFGSCISSAQPQHGWG